MMKLTRDFFMGGNATFTVQNPNGKYYTFKIRQPKGNKPHFKGDNKPHFVNLLTGPDNENSYTYMGMCEPVKIHPKGAPEGTVVEVMGVKLTKASKFTSETEPVKIVRWALQQVWLGEELPQGYQIRHEGKCGCCGRKLTTPESLDRGIGPECWAKMGGA